MSLAIPIMNQRPLDSNPTHASHDDIDNPIPCDHPDCTLPQHPDDIPHSYETRPTRDLGSNPPRYPNRPSPNYVELAMYIDDDVTNDLLAIRHDDTLSDVLTPSTYDEAINSRHVLRWRESMDLEIKDHMGTSTS